MIPEHSICANQNSPDTGMTLSKCAPNLGESKRRRGRQELTELECLISFPNLYSAWITRPSTTLNKTPTMRVRRVSALYNCYEPVHFSLVFSRTRLRVSWDGESRPRCHMLRKRCLVY